MWLKIFMKLSTGLLPIADNSKTTECFTAFNFSFLRINIPDNPFSSASEKEFPKR